MTNTPEKLNSLDRWRTQIRRGYLELCVLALIHDRTRSYGFDMMETLAQRGLAVKEGTLYPLLARMESEGFLMATWETESRRGPPRKLYSVTETGRRALATMRTEFDELQQILQAFFDKEEVNHERCPT